MDLSYHGLSTAEASRLLKENGFNLLPERASVPLLLVFLRQLKSFLTALLFLAAAVSFVALDFLDGTLILLIILINATIGFLQEYKAKREVEALKEMVVSASRVIRDGKEIQVESKYLVPGDLVILESGDKVPADGELLGAANFTADEASLTGESVPVFKEKGDSVFMGTVVLSGRGKFKVLLTDANTRFGRIAKNLEAVPEEKTPLEIKMADLGGKLGLAAIGLICLIGLIGTLQGRDLVEMFFSGVALAVAAVPEGLPAVLTIALAVGVRRLAKRKAIVKRLVATEALGSVDVILTDKTGTLTRNEMTVKKIVTVSGEEFEVGGVGYSSVGEISPSTSLRVKGQVVDSLQEILRVGVLCNGSSLVLAEDHGNTYKVLGDTTEGALLVLAKKAGVDFEAVRKESPILEEIPFDPETRVMSVVVPTSPASGGVRGASDSLTKGAPERIIEKATNLSSEGKKKLLLKAQALASSGMRLVAMAKNEQYLGMVGIYDPPREEVRRSIELCKGAGIHVVMATGDYPETARAIAAEIGLIEKGEEVVSGEQLAEYSDEVLRQNLLNIRVFARVSPADKLRIVEAYQAIGRVVAVTGDGVNDAPALKRAQVGVAMGMTGTDVAKEASDLIITDDNFATIVAAIEEGRVIFANLLKSIKFLLSSNLGEVLTVTGALLLGLPIPLSPLALLWINVVSDGPPALALGVDSKDGEVLRKSAHELRRSQTILGPRDLGFLGGVGILISIVTLFVFWSSLPRGEEFAKLAAFTTIVFLDLLVAFIVRGRKQKLLSNRFLLLSVGVTVAIQIVILAIPEVRRVFA